MRAWSWLNRLVVATTAVVCLVALAVFAVVLVARHQGYQAVTMQTPSMSPVINPGDLVAVRPVAPSAIQAGDIITFRQPIGDHLVVTHRVVRVEQTVEGPAFVTRGDRNETEDPWTLRYTDGTGWRVAHVVPWVGKAQASMQGQVGRVLVAAGLFLVVITLLWPAFAPGKAQAATAATAPEVGA